MRSNFTISATQGGDPVSPGQKTLLDYAGADFAAAFLGNFEKTNPLLAENFTRFAFGTVMADPVLSIREKAIINIVTLNTAGDTSGSLPLHNHAFLSQNGDQATLFSLLNVKDVLKSADSADEIIENKPGLIEDTKAYYLAAIAGITALGMPPDKKNSRPEILKGLFERALFDGVRISQIESALYTVSVARGFPVAIEGGRVFQEYLQETGLAPPPMERGKEPSASAGLTCYMAYAGQEVGESFLKGFAKYNPKMARFTLDFPYQHITANDSAIPGFPLKSSIKLTVLRACQDAPAAWNLHGRAHIRNNQNEDMFEAYVGLGRDLQKSETADDIKIIRELWDRADEFYLPAIAGLAALGSPKEKVLESTIHSALLERVRLDKIRFALNMVAVYRGFPVACAGSAVLQKVLNNFIPPANDAGYTPTFTDAAPR